MTYLKIINAVLRRLRESEVATVDETEYSSLIGDFVNETKREVEVAINWMNLRDTVTITTTSGESSYVLSGLNQGYKILQVINNTEDLCMEQLSFKTINYLLTQNSDSNSIPSHFAYNGLDSDSGYPIVDLYPIPDGVYDIKFYVVNPTLDLTDATDTPVIPSNLLILGAYAKALEERGEDAGPTAMSALARYERALTDEIMIESSYLSDELTWRVE